MGKFIQSLPIIIFLLILTPYSFAKEQSVTANQITIISDKESYNCLPIYNEKGECLIKAQIRIIVNSKQSDYNIKSTFTSTIGNTEYTLKEKYNNKTGLLTSKTKEKLIKTDKDKVKVNIKKDEEIVLDIEFFTMGNGKFNISVSDGVVTTILDPIYNISIEAINPVWYLEGGNVDTTLGIDDYRQKTNITSIMVDNNTATSISIIAGERIRPEYMAYYYRFNNPFLTNVVKDYSDYNHDMTRLTTTNITTNPDFYALGVNMAANGGAIVNNNANLSIGNNDHTICLNWNSTQTLTDGIYYHIMSVSNPAQTTSYEINILQTAGVKAVQCSTRDSNDAGIYRTSSATYNNINDGSPHTICCRRFDGNGTMWTIIDGTPLGSTAGVQTTIPSTGNLIVSGWQTTGNEAVIGYVDELVLYNGVALSNQQVTRNNWYNDSNGSAIQVDFGFTHNHSTNAAALIKIVVNETDTGEIIRLYSMINTTHINATNYISAELTNGANYISTEPVVYDGYDLPYRIITSRVKPTIITDLSLIYIINDTQPPSIRNCFVNDSDVDCDDSVEWGCEVTDLDSIVVTAYGGVSFGGFFPIYRQAFQSVLNTSIWSVKFTANEVHALLEGEGWGFNMTAPVYMSFVNATDGAGLTQTNLTSTPSNIYSCIECHENWIAFYDNCQANETQYKYYLDNNSCASIQDLPEDNGTWVACDFCNPDIFSIAISNCTFNGTDYSTAFSYIDNNYYSCCALTGNITDCTIDYSPYNETFFSSCVNELTQFVVTHPLTCEFDLKQNDKCYFSYNLNKSGDWKCIGLVRTDLGALIQTTPDYTAKVDTIITLGSSDYEDREYFTAYNGIGQAYFTKENLIIDGRSYVFSIQCSNGSVTLQSDHTLVVEYSNLNTPINRGVWSIGQMPQIFFIIISVVIILFIIAVIWGIHKRNTG